MLSKRIIPCLDVRDGQVVKGVQFRNHVIVGDIEELSRRYALEGADELVFYDITASSEKRSVDVEWVKKTAQCIDIPFCVAGGIRSVRDAGLILECGADKISINSPALETPKLIDDLVTAFGSQCVVVGIDSRRNQSHDWKVFQYTGSETTTQAAGRSTLSWLEEVQDRGAGEIVLNCMGSDGAGSGYDLEQLQAVRKNCRVPLVASGGAGTPEHFLDVFQKTRVDAALAAGVFHRGEIAIPELKAFLKENGEVIRWN